VAGRSSQAPAGDSVLLGTATFRLSFSGCGGLKFVLAGAARTSR